MKSKFSIFIFTLLVFSTTILSNYQVAKTIRASFAATELDLSARETDHPFGISSYDPIQLLAESVNGEHSKLLITHPFLDKTVHIKKDFHFLYLAHSPPFFS